MLEQIKQHKYFIIFIFFYFLFKLIYLYYLKLPLSYDEAYYWDWSRILNWGYYSKPPLVAWIIRISTEIFGISEFAVRLPALICNILFLILSYLLMIRYFEKTKAFYLFLTLAFLPIITIYSFIMTIDPPFILFWIASTYSFILYLENPEFKYAILTGILIGLGLLAKQTMFAFLALIFLYLIFLRRNLILKNTDYLIIFLALLIYFPNFYWNYTHQFITFRHTEEHFSRIGFSFKKFLKFFTGCLIAYSPFLLIFIYKGLKYTKKFRFSFDILNVLYFLSYPLSIFFISISIYLKLNINWIMPFIISGLIFTFAYLKFNNSYKNLFKLNLIFIILVSAIILYLGLIYDKAPLFAQPLFAKFKGWKKVAKEAEKYYKPGIPVIVSNRRLAATLAFYMKEHPYIYVVNKENGIKNQYQIWRNDKLLKGKRVLVIKTWNKPPLYLKSPLKLSEIKIKITRNKYRYFSIWQGIWDRD